MVSPGDGTTRTLDIGRVDFTDDEAYAASEAHPENLVPVSWLSYVGPTPERFIVEAVPGTLATDVATVEADAGDAADDAAKARLLAMLGAATPAPPA